MIDNKRSLNIASSVAIILAESLRQTKFIKMNIEIKKNLQAIGLNYYKINL